MKNMSFLCVRVSACECMASFPLPTHAESPCTRRMPSVNVTSLCQVVLFLYSAIYPASINSSDPLIRFSHFSPAAFHTRTECTPSSA